MYGWEDYPYEYCIVAASSMRPLVDYQPYVVLIVNFQATQDSYVSAKPIPYCFLLVFLFIVASVVT